MCSTCGDFYNNCLHYLPVTEVCERYHTDAVFKGNVDDGRANYLSKDQVPFEQEQVSRATCYEVNVERRFTILNDRDWKKAFGEEPRVKVTRYSPSIELHNECGELETYYLFEYDAVAPYRTLMLRRASLRAKEAVVMAKASHVYETQADEVVSQQSAANLDKILAVLSNTRLASLDEKLNKKRAVAGSGGDADGDRSLQSGAAAEKRDSAEALAASLGRPAGSSLKVLDDEDIPVISRRSAAAASSAAQRSPPPAGRQDGGHDHASVAGSARGRARPGARAAADNASAAPSSQRVGSPMKAADGPLDLQGWVDKLDLSDAMGGKAAKLSVHHAEAAVKRWASSELASKKNDAKRLKEHLHLYSLADSVAPAKMKLLDRAEILGVLATLAPKAYIPNDLLVALTCRAVEDFSRKVFDDASAQDFVDCAWPFSTEGGANFNREEPKVSQLPVDVNRKIEIFSSNFMNDRMIYFIERHSSDDAVQLPCLVSALGAKVRGIIEQEADLDELESQVVFELQTVTLALTTLLDPASLLLSGDCSQRLAALGDMMEQSGPPSLFSYDIGLAIKENAVLSASLGKLESRKAAIIENSPVAREAIQVIDSADGDAASCAALKSAAQQVPRVTVSLGEVLASAFTQRVQTVLHKVAGRLLEKAQAATEGCETMQALAELLATASTVFPSDSKLCDFRQEAGAHHTRLSKGAKNETFINLAKELIEAGCVGDKLTNLELALAGLGDDTMTEPVAEVAKELCSLLVREVEASFPDAMLKSHLNVASTMGQLLGDARAPANYPLVKLILLCFDMVDLRAAVEKRITDDRGHLDLTKALEDEGEIERLLVARERAGQHAKSIEKDNSVSAGLKKFCATSMSTLSFLQQIGRVALAQWVDRLQAGCSAVAALQHGLPDGKNWMDGLTEEAKNDDFTALLKHAKATILKCELIAGIQGMVTALETVTSPQTESISTELYFLGGLAGFCQMLRRYFAASTAMVGMLEGLWP